MSQKCGPSFACRIDRGSITAPRSTLLVSCTIRWAAETTRKARWRVVLIPLLETAPTPAPALDPEAALVPDVALDPEDAVLDP
jgi:hypothetical protein